VFCVGLAIGLASFALQYLSPSVFRASKSVEPDRPSVEASPNIALPTQQESLRQMENRPVYPYSVVPGGVRDVAELKWAAKHDPVVAAHYAGFDYDHARVCGWFWRVPPTFRIASGTRSTGRGTE
jgi:hypothetical protein